ncbi:MAG: hypothetical protein CMH57_10065 [Myxococcales bacterium]|nr:hypothetical protein [Myxococcales bacterium]
MKPYCHHCLSLIADAAAPRCSACSRAALPGGGWPRDMWLGEAVDNGRYRVEALLGMGGFGTVYAVRHTLVEDRVLAMKMLNPLSNRDPYLEQLFLDEIRILMRLEHPNIVRCHEVGRLEDGSLFVLMEKLDGQQLDAVVSGPQRAMTPPQVVRLGVAVASALTAAHAHGVLHRDLKPPNVMLLADQEVRVVDFGIAKILGPNTTAQQLSQVIGTPLFMAPEQFTAGTRVDGRLDLYQLGAVLHFALTGHPPYRTHARAGASTLIQVLDQQRQRSGAEGPRPSEINPALKRTAPVLDALIGRLLSTEPERRPSDAEEVRRLLAACPSHSAGGRRTVVERPLAAVTGPPPAKPAPAPSQEPAPSRPASPAPTPTIPEPAPRSVTAVEPDAGVMRASPNTGPTAVQPGARPRRLSAAWTGVLLGSAALLVALIVGTVVVFAALSAMTWGAPMEDPATCCGEWSDSTIMGDDEIQEHHQRGDDLYYGRGVKRDYAAAAEEYDRSCRGVGGHGCLNLGFLYERGDGVEASLEKAVQLYRRGCVKGEARACTHAGVMYDEGRGVSIDRERAVAYFEKACEAKEGRGCSNLGYMYDKGRGVSKDREEAAAYYEQGCEQGDGVGCANLGTMYDTGAGVDKDVARAFELYERSCDSGHARGCSYLGFMYRRGRGVDEDPARAVALYEQGCSGKDGMGCRNLGAMHHKGLGGLSVDRDKAAGLYAQSCELNDDKGCERLRTLCAEAPRPASCP